MKKACETTTIEPSDHAGRNYREARVGFTLVELLAVIGILGLLMALLTPAVFRARAAAVNAKVKAEVDMLHMALMNYKSEYGSLPPADMNGLWNWDNGRVNASHPAYKHLVRIFPRIAERIVDGPGNRESPYKYMSLLSPAQALVFWLRGFYQNQEYPLTNDGAEGTRRKLYEFEEGRLYAASPGRTSSTPSSPLRQTFRPRDAANVPFENEFPVYFTGHRDSELPYVYFDSRCYSSIPDTAYHAQSRSGGNTTARPYLTSNRPLNPTYAQFHVAPETFQLIASGPDASYGPDEMNSQPVPVSFPKPTTLPPGNPLAPQGQNIPSVSDTLRASGHADNITDFASGPLADAADALQAR